MSARGLYEAARPGMDAPQQGFEELERAFEQANFLSLQRSPQPEPHTRPTSKRYSHRLSHAVPTTYADIPSSDSELDVSPVSNDDSSEALHVTITPPLERQSLSRHNSGLPPTPPTMTNSEIVETEEDRDISPVPLFADRVRNALVETQKSGRSTPVIGNISPPTPNSSPPTTADKLHPPRPVLEHSHSSYAESFQTATEGLGNSRSASCSPSQAQLNGKDGPLKEQEGRTEKSAALLSPGLPAYRENWSKQAVEDSDRSEARVRVKNYQMESDSDMDRGGGHLTSDDKDGSANEDTPPSSSRKILNHRAAFQRLRRPLQPGDEMKRPDEALLYGSNRAWRPKKPELIRAPKREMSAEFMRNAGLVKVNVHMNPEQLAALDVPTEASTGAPAPALEEHAQQPRQEKEVPTENVQEKEKPLRPFAPSSAPQDVLSPPTTAAKQSLEDNNQVYRLIQEENVKRHSIISDGSVQAMVLSRPEPHRILRHTKKRESLRANVSVASAGQNSNEDGGAKLLRHKRGSISLNPHEVARRAVSDQHETRQFSPGMRSSSAGPGLAQESLTLEQLMGRHSAVEEDGRLTAGRLGQKMRRQRGQANTPSAVANESRRISSAPAQQPRPWSMDLSAIPQSTPSPRLRRFPRGERLENNFSVRRTSLDHTAYTRDRVEERGFEKTKLVRTHEPEKTGDAHGNSTQKRLSAASQDVDEEPRATSILSGSDSKPRGTARFSQTYSDLPTSPKRRSLDPRYLHSNGTPFSTSQMSDRTALTEPELCEARGVELYPHNNRSLLLIQQAAQPASSRSQLDAVSGAQHPTFKAVVEAPEELEEIGMSKHTVDSPLTNPRAAPEPPVIKFIPPTPSQEIEALLDGPGLVAENPRDNMQRRPSLKQRMRRFSEGLIEPLPFGRNSSMRRTKQQPPPRDQRPTYLSSNWVPNDIWAQYYSDEEDDEEDFEPLPPGGDTSDVGDHNEQEAFPRKLSKRMPGFRGKGGFLQGNSLGIDRHGTNVRRHHIATRASQEMLKQMSERTRRHRVFALPFSRGTKLEYIGFTGLGAKMREVRRRRQERALEKRRDELRRQIGTRVFHQGRA